MPSERKFEAARRNGAKSRGPTTAAGLRNSSRNSLKHGFTSRQIVLLACEDPVEFEQILHEYRATYQPATAAEQDLVDEMVAARWRIRRLWTIETCFLDAEMANFKPSLEISQEPNPPETPSTLASTSRELSARSPMTPAP